MNNKDNIVAVNAELDDLWFMFGSALRYDLKHQTYATSRVPGVIVANFALLDEKWTSNLLRDFSHYERNRAIWHSSADDDNNYENWMQLKRQLLTLYTERGYTRSIE